MKKMRKLEFTILSKDVDKVLEYLGRKGMFQLVEDENFLPDKKPDESLVTHNQKILDHLSKAAEWLGVPLPSEPLDSSRFPGEAEEGIAQSIILLCSSMSGQEKERQEEKQKLEETFTEIKAFSFLNAPFSDLDQLSYLTLRIGRLDSPHQDELRKNLSGRAVVIPLGSEDRFMAAASRKGRFALDSELKKMNFVPISVPEGYKGIPSELLEGLREKIDGINEELAEIAKRKNTLREEYGESLRVLAASYIMSCIAYQLKTRLASTQQAHFLAGWVPADAVKSLVEELEALTFNTIAIRIYKPGELNNVLDGKEKVPVSLNNNAFVKGFEKMVFTYGVPLYGTIDPTPMVAFSFTLLFGVMFGDLGQGIVLLLLGILSGKRGPAFFSRFRIYSVPLVAVGVSSMIMGFLTGSFFANEDFLAGPTRALTGFLTGRPVDHILVIIPIQEKGGSIVKLFYFFGFTISLGVIFNTIGLFVNITNKIYLKKYEEAFFEKTGVAGLLLFWYAVFIAVRAVVSLIHREIDFHFYGFDAIGLMLPLMVIFMGNAVWRFASGQRPVFEDGFLVFVVRGLVDILESISTIISNSVSFLRVGAFALSHAVLSYIIFWFAEMVSHTSAGTAFSILIVVSGNLIIIILEGLIVTIQVIRLQYYEFFSKFFTETGVKFQPFRFHKERSKS